MYSTLIKPLPLLFTAVAAFGVLVHDTHIDKATTVALAVPVAAVIYGATDYAMKFTDGHMHTERVSVGGNLQNLAAAQPRLQPRDDERNTFQKRVYSTGGDNGYAWPSV